MKIIKALFLLLPFCLSLAQAQTNKYSRVLIKGNDPRTLVRSLSEAGITFDHSHISKDGIIAEINSFEQEQLKQNRVEFEVLIDDMSRYYRERNQASQRPAAQATTCNVPGISKPSYFHLGSMGGFFTLFEMEQILDSMQLLYPGLITVKQPISSTQSVEGRDLWYVKISDNPVQDENEPEVLYTALHHAREPQSLSQLIYYMWYLLENYSTDPNVKAIVDNTELFFVPCVNPDGYVYNESTDPNGGGMWRRNRRQNLDNTFGVDINRNYGQYWGYDNLGSSPSTVSDTYRGTGPFSEPEAQAVRNFCNGRQFRAALNAHSYGNHLIYPWGHIPSFYTPDNTTFSNWGALLSEESRYSYGTCDQTLNYITNGSSDDWMYGEQSTKPKIFAFTPETGGFNDGFWPASNRIIDLCKFTFSQNYNLARLAGYCFKATETTDHFVSGSGYLRYTLQSLGLAGGTATVSIVPVSVNIASVGASKVYASLGPNQTIIDSIPYTLAAGVTDGQAVTYGLKVENNGVTSDVETVTKIYGAPVVLYTNTGSSLTGNISISGAWVLDNTQYVSPPSCISDSQGQYNLLENKSITTSTVDLNNAWYAHLQYYTKFNTEKEFDQAQVLLSTNGGSFFPVCAPRVTSPLSFDALSPVYDGRQENWVKEEIDLSPYIGQKIMLRFTFTSDGGNQHDGIYLDDILIRKLQNVVNPTTGLTGLNDRSDSFRVFPNPGSGVFYVNASTPLNGMVSIYNALGQCVQQVVTEASGKIDLSSQPAGIYLVRFNSNGSEVTKRIVLEK